MFFSKFDTQNTSNPPLCFLQWTITQTKQSLRPLTAVQLILPNIVPGDIYQLRSSEIRMPAHSKCEPKMISGLLCEWWLGFSNSAVEPHTCVLGRPALCQVYGPVARSQVECQNTCDEADTSTSHWPALGGDTVILVCAHDYCRGAVQSEMTTSNLTSAMF